MFSNFKYGTPQNEIGEVVTVLAGNNSNELISNTQGKFVLANNVYNKADYPELFDKIGSVGASAWVRLAQPSNDVYYGVAYGIGLYVIAGGSSISMALSSTNLSNWSSYVHIAEGNLYTITYGNGIFVIGSSSGWVGTSTNGTSWTGRVGGDFTGRMTSSHYANGRYLIGGPLHAGGGRIRTSTNGTTWVTTTIPVALAVSGGITYGLGNYYFCGASSIYTATDGITWTSVSSGTTSTITAIGYGNGLFIYGGSNSMIATSTDGSTWTQRSFGVSGATPRTIFYHNGRFFVGCESGILRTSTDGINWSAVGVPNQVNHIWSMTYGNGKYFYAGGGNEPTGGLSNQGQLLASSNTGYLAETSTLYDVSTQFYVPPYTTGSRFYTLPTYGSNSAPRFVNYVRAK